MKNPTARRDPILLGPADIDEGRIRGYDVEDRLVLVSRIGGRFHAIDDCCNHAGCLLSGGRVEGKMIVCPCHEVGFDLVTGRNLNAPEVCGDQPAFEIEYRDGLLYLLVQD